MSRPNFRFTVRTPHAIVVDEQVDSLRVPTETGQVGLRPRAEAMTLAVETGIVVARTGARTRFVGTSGGLLLSDGAGAVLLTPLAATGDESISPPKPNRESPVMNG